MMQSSVIPIAEMAKENMAIFLKSGSEEENLLEMGLYVEWAVAEQGYSDCWAKQGHNESKYVSPNACCELN